MKQRRKEDESHTTALSGAYETADAGKQASFSLAVVNQKSATTRNANKLKTSLSQRTLTKGGPGSNSRSMALLQAGVGSAAQQRQQLMSQASKAPCVITTQLQLGESGAKQGVKQGGGLLSVHHRRKSSERFVTNEGPRKGIKDFDIFEMQGRKKPAQSFKNVSKQSATQQMKRIASGKTQQSQNVQQQKAKKVESKTRKMSCSSTKDDHLQTLPKIEQVDDLFMHKKSLGFTHKFSSSLYVGGLGSEPSLGEVSAQKSTSRKVTSPKLGISVATINLTGMIDNSRSESRKQDSRSDQHHLETTSSLFPSQQHLLDESNQVGASMLSSLNGTQFQQTMQQVSGLALETHSSGVIHNAARGANPQEDRSYQTLKMSRPFPKNLVTQEEESISAIQSEAPENPSAQSSAHKQNLLENATSSGQKDFGYAADISSASKPASIVDHRRCLTAEFNLIGGASKGRASIKDFDPFDGKKHSIGQLPAREPKPQTTTKKSQRNQKPSQQIQSIEEASRDIRSVQMKVMPQTTRHSSTSFGFANGFISASKGSLANKGQATKLTRGKTPPQQQSHQRQPKSGRNSIVQQHHHHQSEGQTQCKPQSFVSKAAVMTSQKLTSLAPKFTAAKVMKHTSTVAKPGSQKTLSIVASGTGKQAKGNGGASKVQQTHLAQSSSSSILVTPLDSAPQTTNAAHQSQTSMSNLSKITPRKSIVSSKQQTRAKKRAEPQQIKVQQRMAPATAMSVERQRNIGEEDTVGKQKNRTKTSLKTYMDSNVRKSARLASAQGQLGSQSLTRQDKNQTHGTITNKINNSCYNSVSSLKVLNQTSQVSSSQKNILGGPFVTQTTYSSVPKQSSLKKQQFLKKAPHASSFLNQSKKSLQEESAQKPANDKRHQITNLENLQEDTCYVVNSRLAQPRVSLQSHHTRKLSVNPENTKNDTIESGKQFKKVPRHLIRASSCSGLRQQQPNQPSKIHFRQLSKDSNLTKPKTKCQFTQLQIIRQKDSSGSLGNEQNSTSRIDDYSKTYSSNPSTVVVPPTIKVQRQASVRDNCRHLIKQAISSSVSLIPGGPGDVSTQQKSRQHQTMHKFDTQGNHSSNNADVRFSAKEALSTLGKETQSHFDFSNGLPECLRSNQKEVKFGHPADTSSNGKTSFNDFNLALLNNQDSVPFTAKEDASENNRVDHQAFLQDFIDEPIGNGVNQIRQEVTSPSDLNIDKLAIREEEDFPLSSTLDIEVPESQPHQFESLKGSNSAVKKYDEQRVTRKHSYNEERVAQDYYKVGNGNQQRQSLLQVGKKEAATSGFGLEDVESHQLLASSFLSTDPNQQSCQMTYSKASKKSQSPTTAQQQHHYLQMTLRGSANLPLDASLLKQSQSMFRQSGNSHSKQLLSHSKFLLNGNNSGAQSTHKQSADEPLWTLSNEDATSRQEGPEDFVFNNLPSPSKEQAPMQPLSDRKPVRSIIEEDDDLDFENQMESNRQDFADVMSQKDLISVSEAHRPSIDQMLPTRYSQLLLDSQRQSSICQNRETNQFLLLTPTDGSSTYLSRKQRLLDQQIGNAAQHRLANQGSLTRDSKTLVLPFERVNSAAMQEVLENSEVVPEEEEQIFNESTVKEDEYGNEMANLRISGAHGREQQSPQQSDDDVFAFSQLQPVTSDCSEHLHRDEICVSVMDGVQLDQGMADRWLNNQDQLRPKVIEDDDDDDDGGAQINTSTMSVN